MAVKISGVIITYNEEKTIERCVLSLQKVADEIVVIDSFSTDKTKEICKRLNVRFIENPFVSFGDQKRFAVAQAKNDYILSLDADEALSDEVIQSVLKVKNSWTKDAYKIKRRNYYCGKWLRFSGKYPDKKIRLFDRRKASWINRQVHETVEAENPQFVETISGDLLHLEYHSYFAHAKKIEQYSTLSAIYYHEKNRKSSLWHIYYRPLWAFFYSYFIRLGVLDGKQGLIFCYFNAYNTYLKYVKLYGLQQGQELP